MASVRLTQELRSGISREAVHAFHVANPEPKPSTEFEQRLRDAIPRVPTQIALKNMYDIAMENNMYETKAFGCSNTSNRLNFTTLDKISIEGLDPLEDGPYRHAGVLVELSAPVNIIRAGDGYWGAPHQINVNAFAIEDQTYITEQANELLKKRVQRDNKDREYKDTIDDLLKRCNTLKQLLEIWPAAENLIPQHLIVKLHEKVTRKQRAQQVKEEIHFNADEINKVVLTAKLMGA